MNEPWENFSPYWLQTAAPSGANGGLLDSLTRPADEQWNDLQPMKFGQTPWGQMTSPQSLFGLSPTLRSTPPGSLHSSAPSWLNTASPFGADIKQPAWPDLSAAPGLVMHSWEYPWPHKSPLDMWAESTQPTPSAAQPPTFPPALPREHLDSGKYWPVAPSIATAQPPAHGFYFSPLPRTPPAAPSGASVSTTEDVLRTAPAALARGTALAFGGTGDARELAGKGISWALQKAGIEISPETVQRAKSAALRSNPFAALVMSAPTSEDLTEKVESVTGPLYQPQTRVGKYVNSALEFVPGAVTGGPVAGGLRALPGVAFRYGVIPGLVSEAAGHATEGTAAEPWARSGAALASGGAAGWLAHRSAPRGAAVPQRPVVEQSPHATVAGDVPIATPGMSERLLPKSLEGKSAGLYEPPVKPQRPFSADYPSGAPTDASGRLVADIEGRPLHAKHIAGRRVAGQADEALSPPQANSIIEEATGSLPREVSNREMRGNAGFFYPSSRQIKINQELIPKQKELTLWHETGHLLDDISAGKKGMSVKGLEQELEDVYSTLNTGKEQASPRILPRDQGYSRSEAPYEYIAEALRAYMTNPNYFKAVAPNAAAAIRALVNSHPQLSKLVQFNSLAGLAALGGALGTTNDDERNL